MSAPLGYILVDKYADGKRVVLPGMCNLHQGRDEAEEYRLHAPHAYLHTLTVEPVGAHADSSRGELEGYDYDHAYMAGGKGCYCLFRVYRKPHPGCPKSHLAAPEALPGETK